MRRRRKPIVEEEVSVRRREKDVQRVLKKPSNCVDSNSIGVGTQIRAWVSILVMILSGSYLLWNILVPVAMEVFSGMTVYTIPNSLPEVGDKSLKYQLLRFLYDLYQNDEHSLEVNERLIWRKTDTLLSKETYNIADCPSEPSALYPYAWNAVSVVSNWAIANLTTPHTIYQSLCSFNYTIDYDKALNYRRLELPFVVRGDPAVARAVERFHKPSYLERLLGEIPHRTEVSNSSRYMYWAHPELSKRRAARSPRALPINYDPPPGWEPPTRMTKMTYREWVQVANTTTDTQHKFYYFQTVGCGNVPKCEDGSTEFLYDELTFFQPRKESLYVVDPEKQKGIHCRFGMPGLTVAAHFDGSRNSIVVLKGSRRYILAHPNQCPKLGLYPMGHPSSRHSSLEWTPDDLVDGAQVSEVILQPGDMLYLPTHWFHMIVSLDLNIQCNSRSGADERHTKSIVDCGFRQEF